MIFNICDCSLFALSLAKLSDEVLIRNANSIVYGVVESAVPEKINNMIFTHYSVRIKTDGMVKKGSIENNSLVDFYMIGGRIGSEWLDVPGLVKLDLGKEYVLFFEKMQLGFTIFGSNQGAFPIVVDPITGESIVVKKADPEVMGSSETSNKSARLDDFIKYVKDVGGYN